MNSEKDLRQQQEDFEISQQETRNCERHLDKLTNELTHFKNAHQEDTRR